MNRMRICFVMPLVLLFASCVGTDGEEGCAPGDTRSCLCGGDSSQGVQSCLGEGLGWGECNCETGDSDSDTDVDTDSDADTDVDTDADSDTNTPDCGDVSSETDTLELDGYCPDEGLLESLPNSEYEVLTTFECNAARCGNEEPTQIIDNDTKWSAFLTLNALDLPQVNFDTHRVAVAGKHFTSVCDLEVIKTEIYSYCDISPHVEIYFQTNGLHDCDQEQGLFVVISLKTAVETPTVCARTVLDIVDPP